MRDSSTFHEMPQVMPGTLLRRQANGEPSGRRAQGCREPRTAQESNGQPRRAQAGHACMRSGRQLAEQEAGAKHNVETRCSKIAHAAADRTRMIDRTRIMMPACAIFEQRVSTLRLAPAVGSTPCRPDLAGSQRANNSEPAASRQAGSKAGRRASNRRAYRSR